MAGAATVARVWACTGAATKLAATGASSIIAATVERSLACMESPPKVSVMAAT
jgi:hypothetical protein